LCVTTFEPRALDFVEAAAGGIVLEDGTGVSAIFFLGMNSCFLMKSFLCILAERNPKSMKNVL
jgi:hypothetical protein